jgi:hypothetical protein
MSLHTFTLSLLRVNQSLLLPLSLNSREASITNFIVFGFTWTGIEAMIYHIRGECANYYTMYVTFFL